MEKDLRVRSFQFGVAIINFCNILPNKSIYWPVRDQLLRSATSVGANIIEAKSSPSKKDFLHFYTIALKSANETVYWLNMLKESDLKLGVDIDLLNNLLFELDEVCRMLGRSVITMKKSLN